MIPSSVDFEAEVRERLKHWVEDQRREVRAAYVVAAVVGGHPIPEFEDTYWYRAAAHRAVRDAVRKVIRDYSAQEETPSNPQMILPGFKLVQTAYLIKRNGDQVIVPTEQMTATELRTKSAELRRMAVGCMEHADELDRLCAKKFGTTSEPPQASA